MTGKVIYIGVFLLLAYVAMQWGEWYPASSKCQEAIAQRRKVARGSYPPGVREGARQDAIAQVVMWCE
jgi:hypothetical protein